MIFITILSVLTILYTFLHLWILKGLQQQKPNHSEIKISHSISILICVRNEAENLPDLISSLKRQTSPNILEILFADDRSDDNSPAILKKAASEDHRIRIIRINEVSAHLSPKKNALNQLVSMAKGDIILTTDADCQLPTEWAENMLRAFDENTNMVTGFSQIHADHRSSLFLGIQALEFFFLFCRIFCRHFPKKTH
jgi:glycosyltransferase involved in cell wall biosynthesis